jgi:two-component system, cell cycle sensor histidine kinase and response regulator CckA
LLFSDIFQYLSIMNPTQTILLVEDQTGTVKLVARQLQRFGYDVVSVSTGEAAVDVGIHDESIDLILMDILLGEGIDGTEAAKQILASRNIPIVFLSSHTERETVEKVRGITRYGYVLKNSDEFILQSSIEMAFELFGANMQLLTELSERKRAEEALRENEDKYRGLVENSPDAIAIYVDGIIVFVNNECVRLMAANTTGELLGKPVMKFVHPDDRARVIQRMKDVAVNAKSLPTEEERFIRLDGTIVDVEVKAMALTYERKPAVQLIVHDITERKRLEQQFFQAQKMEGLGTLAGGIAHDFNNILGIITGHVQLLDQTQCSAETLRRHAGAIGKAADRGAALVQQLLTFARKSNATLEPIQVNEIIQELHRLFTETFPKDIAIVADLDPNIPSIVADGSQIHQVILNLCINARDAMPSGGSLFLTTNIVPSESLHMHAFSAGARHYVEIIVADTGSGMDEETCKKIFEPFFTTKEQGKGTGLGLAVVFGIVESHKGCINIRSDVGKGTAFEIYFPIQERSDDLLIDQHEIPAEVPGGTETVLLVEDEVLLLDIARSALESKGYTVLTAIDGEDAIALYASHRNEIHVVLSDFGLPKFTGYELYKKLALLNPNVLMIITSGFLEPGIHARILEDGVKAFIQKPYRPHEVFRAIRRVLDDGMEKAP